MKPLNLPKESQEALLNGAHVFIIPCEQYTVAKKYQPEAYKVQKLSNTTAVVVSKGSSSIREVGDKIGGIDLNDLSLWTPISAYQTSDRCFLTLNTHAIFDIKDIKVVRVHELSTLQVVNTPFQFFEEFYSKQYNDYDENPYVFLYEIERI